MVKVQFFLYGVLCRICYGTSILKVAELGGILGLFVGFSFLGLLDALIDVSCSTVSSFKTNNSLQWCMNKRLQT